MPCGCFCLFSEPGNLTFASSLHDEISPHQDSVHSVSDLALHMAPSHTMVSLRNFVTCAAVGQTSYFFLDSSSQLIITKLSNDAGKPLEYIKLGIPF